MYNTSFALVEGNLARSFDTVYQAERVRPYNTTIVELPVRTRVEPAQDKRLSVAPRSAAMTRMQLVVTAVALVMLLGCVLMAAWTMLDRPAQAFDAALANTPQQTVTVSAGASLWSLAEAHQVDGLSTQQTTELIRAWNDLDSSMLQPGDTLVVPA